MHIGVVDEREMPQEQEIVEYRNQAAKDHRSQPRNQSDQDGQKVKHQQANRLSSDYILRNHLTPA